MPPNNHSLNGFGITLKAKNNCKKRCILPELEHEEAIEAEFEITDLDPQHKSSPALNRWLDGQRLSSRTRLWMALFTILGVALFSLLLVSPLHVTGTPNLVKASNAQFFPSSHPAPPHFVQMLIVHNVIYLVDQDGLVKALWTRHKYVYVLWQHNVAPSSTLLSVDHNIVYLVSPRGRIVALRASDGAVLWTRRGTR